MVRILTAVLDGLNCIFFNNLFSGAPNIYFDLKKLQQLTHLIMKKRFIFVLLKAVLSICGYVPVLPGVIGVEHCGTAYCLLLGVRCDKSITCQVHVSLPP